MVPSYGAHSANPLRTPFGYDKCATGKLGWHARSAVWDRVLSPEAEQSKREAGLEAALEGERGTRAARQGQTGRDEL